MILQLAESRSAVTQILPLEENPYKKEYMKSPGATVLDKVMTYTGRVFKINFPSR